MTDQFDAIFCRNVMIYFDKPTRSCACCGSWRGTCKPDGLLFAGHSESFSFAADVLRLRGQTVYELAARGR